MEIQVYRGYWMVEWFKREFGHHEVAPRRPRRASSPRRCSTISSGRCRRARWASPSSRTGHPACANPGPEAKGAIIGFGDVHTRAHVYRAIIEGLAYALREGAERTAKRTGVPLTSLRIAGGGSQSPAAVQLTADVFGLPVGARTHARGVRARGGRWTRRSGWASIGTSATAAAAMVRVGEVRDPDPATHALYDELYRGVYRPMYGRLQPLYREIRRITGYPPG